MPACSRNERLCVLENNIPLGYASLASGKTKEKDEPEELAKPLDLLDMHLNTNANSPLAMMDIFSLFAVKRLESGGLIKLCCVLNVKIWPIKTPVPKPDS